MTVLLAGLLWCVTQAVSDEESPPTKPSVHVQKGSLSAVFRDNSESPQRLSGIDSLFHVAEPDFDAFDPAGAGASAGLNFEHVVSGHRNPNNRFTPRHGRYTVRALPDGHSAVLVRQAADSPWKIDSTFQLTVVEPHFIDFEFRCVPRDASLFGRRGYAIFQFASYMNDVEDPAIHFRGRRSAQGPEEWIAADAPDGHPDWNRGGNYRSIDAEDLVCDEDVEFRLNTWSYDWPRFSRPFFYGRAAHGMTFLLMFDRMQTEIDEIRFSLYKFKLPRHPRPAWDFQYVVHEIHEDQEYSFRGRLVWKRFVSAEDCWEEYRRWARGSSR